MGETVVADFVAVPDGGLHQLGIAFHMGAQDEESPMDLMLLQYGQDLPGIARRGAIIEGESHLSHLRGAAPNNPRVRRPGGTRLGRQLEQGY